MLRFLEPFLQWGVQVSDILIFLKLKTAEISFPDFQMSKRGSKFTLSYSGTGRVPLDDGGDVGGVGAGPDHDPLHRAKAVQPLAESRLVPYLPQHCSFNYFYRYS